MEMVQSTKDLVAYLSLKDKKPDYSIVKMYVDTILNCGSKADADALLAFFLEEPNDSYRSDLLRVIRAFGDASYAPQLAEKCFHSRILIENVPEDILEMLGYFRYELFKPVLADYAFRKIQSGYYEERAAVLGLLHFDCTDYRELISQEIEKCYGQGLFPEFIPALVCKLDEPQRSEIVTRLYELGNDYASTDCNAGIILGFSLCGEVGRNYFERILFDQRWECCDRGTGSGHFTYQGINHLGIDFKELYQQVLAVENKPELAYHVTVFLELLRKRISDPEFTDLKSLTELFDLLFSWENPNKQNHFWDLLDRAELREEGYQTEKMLIRKLKERAVLSNFKE